MSERKFIFRSGSTELSLPVTPESYRVETGINIEVVNIHTLGDAILTGYGTLATIQISCMLPSQRYPFADSSNPDYYISQFEKWIKKKSKVRFVIGGTGVNVQTIIQSIAYGERDGTNDVYADIILREYRTLAAVKVAKPTASKPRGGTTQTASSSVTNYKVVYGDTLCGICRRFYGDGSYSLAKRLSAYNFGSRDPNILYAGETVAIPKPLP